MHSCEHLAIIGSGPSCIYLLKHLADAANALHKQLREISIFEKFSMLGMGMPYHPRTTDRYNMANIAPEELPELPQSFSDWLRAQDPAHLKSLGVEVTEIHEDGIYSRLALGEYLQAQYEALLARLKNQGIVIHEYSRCPISDIQDCPDTKRVTVVTAQGAAHEFDRVIIATGHRWVEEDRPEEGYYASPWPISKLLPKEGQHHNFPIGTLGASLSAFDVIASLSHRHGNFSRESGRLVFRPHPGTEDFKIVMHSGHGILPHLQFDQEEPFRKIYRHVHREELLSLLDTQGFLRIETYFDKVCRPALKNAFEKDGMGEMVESLDSPEFCFGDFVEKMSDEHAYANAFDGMRVEMKDARDSVLNHHPIHWKEVCDDLIYTLNFHAELMPAEDHLFMHTKVMPFLMNVIAAMPLHSGDTVLALYDAGKLEMITGKARVTKKQQEGGMTTVIVTEEGEESTWDYRMFIDCSGQKALELEDYPFPSLVKDGTVRTARALFKDPGEFDNAVPDKERSHIFKEGGKTFYRIGGVDIDATFRLIGSDGQSNPRIYDIAFPHTSGVRPYSYGLQACSDTSEILVRALAEELKAALPADDNLEEVTKIYEKV